MKVCDKLQNPMSEEDTSFPEFAYGNNSCSVTLVAVVAVVVDCCYSSNSGSSNSGSRYSDNCLYLHF